MSSATRIPGRTRLAGVFSGDNATFAALLLVGFAGSVFFRSDGFSETLLAGAPGDIADGLALLVVCAALVMRSLLRRGFLWAEAPVLTWLDFGVDDRVTTIGRRLWTVWLGWFVTLGYLGALLSVLYGVPPDIWFAGGVLLLGIMSVVVVIVRWGGTGRAVERAAPLALACYGLVIAAVGAGTGWLLGTGAALLLTACLLWPVSGSMLRPTAAARAGRAELLAGWSNRLLRYVGVQFLEPMLAAPEAQPVGGRSLRGHALLRFAWLGALARARYADTAVLLALVALLAGAALPGVSDVVLVGVAGFAALMPFGAGIGQLWRSPGLRRWFDASDLKLRTVHAAMLGGLALGWGMVLFAGGLVLDELPSPAAWFALPLAAGTVLRIATRRPVDYGDIGVLATPFGQLPARLVGPLLSGPTPGVVGIVVLAAGPLSWFSVLVTCALTALCVSR